MKIRPGQRTRVVAQPQGGAFKPRQITVENGDRWIVHDIAVGNQSQFSQQGDIPGTFFAPGAGDNAIRFSTVQTAMDLVFDVTYQGPDPDGEQFRAMVKGVSAN